ncbi:MAG: cystathionine beta-lyase [Alphaproteobacteria bacterium]|nr:cystathionine beta-lyase [Alphaproteobacteria bacterium]
MKKETLLTHMGSTPKQHQGIINIPAYRASTILFPDLAAFDASEKGQYPHPTYARYGTPSTQALEESIAELEGADYALVTATGLSAITVALFAFLGAGDHLLMVDTVYGSTRRFCDLELARMGVEITYYDPAIGENIGSLIKPNTKVVFCESPGSLTFELQDISAIAKVAHLHNVVVISDNTWGTPIYFHPFDMGVDVSIQSATKYMSGHSDLMMGSISCKKEHYAALRRAFGNIGACPTGDNCYLAMRGLRTLAVRVKQHYENSLIVARWLAARPEVEKVLYPALPDAPGHDLWKRDFSGACGLFSFVLKDVPERKKLAAMLDNLDYFGMGWSWGGYESLIVPVDLSKVRTASKFPYKGQLLRIHIGLENPDDLMADLAAGFDRLKAGA